MDHYYIFFSPIGNAQQHSFFAHGTLNIEYGIERFSVAHKRYIQNSMTQFFFWKSQRLFNWNDVILLSSLFFSSHVKFYFERNSILVFARFEFIFDLIFS